jgi:hypothetical protein
MFLQTPSYGHVRKKASIHTIESRIGQTGKLLQSPFDKPE